MPNLALVLTGGGARAAYQAGVVRALAEIWPRKASPFKIITGMSAGSINACQLAHTADDFMAGTERLWQLWNTLHIDKVFRSNSLSLLRLATFVLRDLALGGFFPRPASNHLLDASPLRKLIEENVDFDRIHAHVKQGLLRAFAVTATNYRSGCAITFFDETGDKQEWVRNNHLGFRRKLKVEHILGSSAIPVFFPAVNIDGSFYGDGCVRLMTPVSPSLHLGAESVLAVGVRQPKDPARMLELSTLPSDDVNFADIAGVFMNAVFLDTLDTDLERLRRVNMTLRGMAPQARENLENNFRTIPFDAVQPTKDLGLVASGSIDRYPFMMRHLLRGLGAGRKRGRDVLSYLAFDRSYCGKLLRMGYRDAMDRKDHLRQFMLQNADPA